MLPIDFLSVRKSPPFSAVADSGDWKSIFVDKSSERASKDERILQITHELCDQLGITRSVPRRVSWTDRIFRGKGTGVLVTSDECVIALGDLILPDRMRDVLEPED